MRPQILHKALVMPLCGTLDGFYAGVFADGVCRDESLLYRCGRPHGCAAEADALEKGLSQARPLPGDWLYGGYLFRHYGHFLLETLSRVYALRRSPALPLLFSSTHREIMPWQHEIFRLLGLRNEIVLHRDPVIPERLLLAAPGFSLPDSVVPEQIAALGALTPPPLTDRCIWLARSSYLGGGLVNERELEPELVRRGWEIIHPQYMPIRQQVALIASARHVAGLDGSAFHTALLASTVRGTFTIFMLRNRSNSCYAHIAALKGMQQTEIPLHARYLLGEGAEQFYQLDDLNEIFAQLPSTAPDSSRR